MQFSTFLLMVSLIIVLTEILTEEQKKEELEKLYSAIGYTEGEVITAFPKEVDCIFICSYMCSDAVEI